MDFQHRLDNFQHVLGRLQSSVEALTPSLTGRKTGPAPKRSQARLKGRLLAESAAPLDNPQTLPRTSLPSFASPPEVDFLLERYHSRLAIVSSLGERFADHNYEYWNEVARRELLRDHEEALSVRDDDFEEMSERENDDILQELKHAMEEAERLKADCISAGATALQAAQHQSFYEPIKTGITRNPRSRIVPFYEPEIRGYLNGTAVAFFPDNQSAHDIVSHDYAKRKHLEINNSNQGRLRTARGSQVNALGTIALTVRFAEESKEYIREFQVLPKCVHDIILGSPFLRLTQTFTKFRHRVVKKLRGTSMRHRVCLTGSSQEMLSGWANGQSILALPDTGSDICLMSLRYAQERGYHIDTDLKHRKLLEFVDGSTAETFGRVEGFQWEFDRSDIHLHSPEVHVLENLQTDLLLGYEFLEDCDAFGTHEELFTEAELHDGIVDDLFGLLVSTIKLVTNSKVWGHGRQFAQKLGWKSPDHSHSGVLSNQGLAFRMATSLLIAQSPTEPSDLQKWHNRKPLELTTYERSCTAARGLSEPHRTSALSDARVRWKKFWAEWPGCGNTSHCTAQTPCGHGGCNYTPLDTSTTEPAPIQAATGVAPMPDLHLPDLTTASAGALPDPGPAPSVLDPTRNTIGTNAPSPVDPPGIVASSVLHVAISAPQAAPQTFADRLTIWQTISGLTRMFAKSDNKTSITTALLCLLMLHFAGISFF